MATLLGQQRPRVVARRGAPHGALPVVKSPQVSSSSGSSSEADDEEADGRGRGEPPGAPQEGTARGNGNPSTADGKADSPPPSYPAPQVRLHPSELSVVRGPLALGLLPRALGGVRAESGLGEWLPKGRPGESRGTLPRIPRTGEAESVCLSHLNSVRNVSVLQNPSQCGHLDVMEILSL